MMRGEKDSASTQKSHFKISFLIYSVMTVSALMLHPRDARDLEIGERGGGGREGESEGEKE